MIECVCCRGNETSKMAVLMQMFLFLFKTKFRRKYGIQSVILCFVIIYSSVFTIFCSAKCSEVHCVNGECVNGTCVCLDGWQGPSCQFCGGKVRLSGPSGVIHDGVGNYSTDVKCSWLIDAGSSPNASIRLHFEEFATECGWDHLYIFDGDSVHSKLLAVLSGLMYKEDYAIRRTPEIVANSGFALLHFYSDVAYNMTGFNISYRLNSCPSRMSGLNCSGHGVCIDGVCTCDALFTGEACDTPICPNNCSYSNGVCNAEQHRCDCNHKYRGEDCSQVAEMGYWETVQIKDFVPEGSASHSAVVWRDSLYIIGGESYYHPPPNELPKLIYVYDFNGKVWETHHMESRNIPTMRYGHSAVLFGDKIYVYGGVKLGGVVCSELWAFDVSAKTWENITVRAEQCYSLSNSSSVNLCGPLKSSGHTATLVTTNKQKKSEKMVVIFGHSPTYGYLNTVQEFHFGTREWIVVKTKGFPVKGGYGHSSSWDPMTQRIYVYGGFVSEFPSTPILSNRLYAYDPDLYTWTLLSSAPSARFLHTATFVHGLMLVFGGNTHNDTATSHGAKCYSKDFLAYDVTCDTWTSLAVPASLRADLARFGHSAVTFEHQLYVYGGFDGQMLNDMLRYVPGSCSSLSSSKSQCLNHKLGWKCVWNRRENKCVALSQLPPDQQRHPSDIDHENDAIIRCPETASRSSVAANIVACSQLSDCTSCVHVARLRLVSASQVCTHDHKCKEPIPTRTASMPFALSRQHTSAASKMSRSAGSCIRARPARPTHSAGGSTPGPCKAAANLSIEEQHEPVVCPNSCAQLTSCLNCTQEECIWCQNEERCVDKTAYTASFPYGQCREWTTQHYRCRSTNGASGCSDYRTCDECRNAPECGWCDDGSGTGLGKCLSGGAHNSMDVCQKEHWYFTRCPTCQCNGHSTCSNNTAICDPCGNQTTGPHCERCKPGYHGNPVNGGVCEPCQCNDHGTQCDQETGKCYCTTKGIVGDHCERCDVQNHYHGDPTNHGSCFYDLTIDYQFTFNLSKKDDRHFTQINFKNSPPKPDIDADFLITCSVLAKMNITIKTASSLEIPIISGYNCTTYRYKFNKADFSFGVMDNVTYTTFYVYVYDFHPPLWIQISFSQYPKLNLQQFFITFSSCFLALLLVAAVLWKIKQKYDMYRRRQRINVEMEKMASRPFSQVFVEIEKRDNSASQQDTTSVTSTLKKRKKDSPSPIALEPCCGNRAAVLSLLIRLPTGGEMYTPTGQSAGLAIASALVTLGNPRKVSIDPTTKMDAKGKTRKSVSSQHLDSCI
ncbi:attractin-like protein 1 isoform X2 [Nilaparvata lugens]|uniref:attractin-like protein 1 isoform X1 n=1 Tax=Nilaparvata lugens TaxID=108931 RepID=UPI00193DDB9A|nr:attractin-like protein 1 isoform X1 [Nilaparvata lugens]XP_039300296.1 attractin-like protein 1 isoform X2 [Nilaparvata lugens]